MKKQDFSNLSDSELFRIASTSESGSGRLPAIFALVERALREHSLLPGVCKIISSDRRIGFHKGAPLGWFAADQIFLSGQKPAIEILLREMSAWDSQEQEDLIRHWAGRQGLGTLTRELEANYGWMPRYELDK